MVAILGSYSVILQHFGFRRLCRFKSDVVIIVNNARFQAFTVKLLRTVLFWVIIQWVVGIFYHCSLCTNPEEWSSHCKWWNGILILRSGGLLRYFLSIFMDRLRKKEYFIHRSQPPDRIWTGCYKFSNVQSGDCSRVWSFRWWHNIVL